MIRVKNLHGTADNTPPTGYTSWIDYWRKKTGRHGHCQICYTSNDLVGAHVMKLGLDTDKKWYITPLCPKHNQVETAFDVPDADLIPVR